MSVGFIQAWLVICTLSQIGSVLGFVCLAKEPQWGLEGARRSRLDESWQVLWQMESVLLFMLDGSLSLAQVHSRLAGTYFDMEGFSWLICKLWLKLYSGIGWIVVGRFPQELVQNLFLESI